MPAVGRKARGHILAHGDVRVALDGDVVVVVEQDQLAQAQRARQGRSLGGDALHHAAVAADGVGVVIDDRESRAVELGRQVRLGHRKAHGVGHALAQRAGGRLHAHGVAVLGVAGRPGAPLAERLEVIHRQAVAIQVQQRVQQRGRMARGEHEAVAVGPLGVARAVAHLLLPQGIGHGGHAHRRAGMAGVRLLHGVGGQHTDGVDAARIQLVHVQDILSLMVF